MAQVASSVKGKREKMKSSGRPREKTMKTLRQQNSPAQTTIRAPRIFKNSPFAHQASEAALMRVLHVVLQCDSSMPLQRPVSWRIVIMTTRRSRRRIKIKKRIKKPAFLFGGRPSVIQAKRRK